MSEASECGVTSNCKCSADYQSSAYGHVGDPGPAGYARLFQRAVDKKTVVVADKGCGNTTSEISALRTKPVFFSPRMNLSEPHCKH